MRIVVFDFDGTLVDSNTIKRDCFLAMARFDAGGEVRMDRLLDTVEGNRFAIWEAYVRERDGDRYRASTVIRSIQAFNKMVDDAITTAPEMPGATELLHCLQKFGIHLAVSSATPLENLKLILERRSWHDFFKTIAGSPTGKIHTLHSLSVKLQVGCDKFAVVGDGQDDRASAECFGCTFYPVGEGRGTPPEERIYTLHELSEVMSALIRLNLYE